MLPLIRLRFAQPPSPRRRLCAPSLDPIGANCVARICSIAIFVLHLHPYRTHLQHKGLSHELNKYPSDTCLHRLRQCRSFESHYDQSRNEKADPFGTTFSFLGWVMGLINQGSHQCLHWCQQYATGILHFRWSSPKKDSKTPNCLLLPKCHQKSGTPGGTRTPDLLLRSVGKGVFSVLKRPFGAVWSDVWGCDLPFVLRCPHWFFPFWVRIWVKNLCLVTPNCNQAQ